jgi:hypothetical protein
MDSHSTGHTDSYAVGRRAGYHKRDNYYQLIRTLARVVGWGSEGAESAVRRDSISGRHRRPGPHCCGVNFFLAWVIVMHISSAVAEAKRRLEDVYVQWADSPEAREILSASLEAFFASPEGIRVREAAMKAALLQLKAPYRSEHPFLLKSKEEREKLYLEWALAQPQWGDLLNRELLRFRVYRDAESQAFQSLVHVFEERPEVQPLIADLLTAQREDRQRVEAAQRTREAERPASAAPSLPPPLRAEKRAAKRARKQQLNERRAEEAKARDEHRLNWLAQHGRRSLWA